jgi:hypothetical protein
MTRKHFEALAAALRSNAPSPESSSYEIEAELFESIVNVHGGRDTTTNRRPDDPLLAVWEIHPVMQLTVIKPK